VKHWREWRGVIWMPESYWKLTDEEQAGICNGCGPAKAKFDFVPDTMWGLDMEPVCSGHDYLYEIGKTLEDKFNADTTMLLNAIRVIDWKGGWLRVPRIYRACSYFIAVHYKGKEAYLDKKPWLRRSDA